MPREIEDTMRDNAQLWKQSPLVRLHESAPLLTIMCDEMADLRSRLATAERERDEARADAALKLAQLWQVQPQYFDDCDPGQNDPHDAWHAEMDALARAALEGTRG